jgi:hypothetical protein
MENNAAMAEVSGAEVWLVDEKVLAVPLLEVEWHSHVGFSVAFV